jgi:SPOR domain
MADNNFRPFRGRDPVAPANAGAATRASSDDPLAELARLIGQGDPVSDYGRDGRGGHSFDDAAPDGGMDWAAGDAYAEPAAPARDRYAPYPSPPPAPALPLRDYAPAAEPRYRDEPPPPASYGRQLPAFPPRSRDARYEYDDAESDAPDDQAYALEDYEEDAPRRRSGFVVVAAVLALAVLGTAGAFAYRAMFGGSMLPSLPPIIKAEDGPNKIVPSAGDSYGAAAKPAGASGTGSGEKLVSREEKPLDVPAPVTTAPRVVSTIPIFPAPTPGAPGAPPSGATAPNVLGPIAQAPAAPAPVAPAPAVPPGLGATDGTTAPLAPAAPPPTVLPGSKKVHTVTIRPDQPAAPDAAAAPPAAMPPPPARTAAPRAAVPAAPRPSAAQAGANAPLEIVPPQGDAPPAAAAHPRTAVARPTALAPAAGAEPQAAAGGGYAVQVTSQRSEAEAQTAFRALAAKYPDQLGGRAPLVRRADLGSKGVFYRALVGPYASMEQAAGVCSNLKAAGGSCIVQKN